MGMQFTLSKELSLRFDLSLWFIHETELLLPDYYTKVIFLEMTEVPQVESDLLLR